MGENSEMNREVKHRMYCDERMAQEIRENNQKLRELESRIRAAYVSKALKLQLAEREKQRLVEKLRTENDIQRMKQKLHEDTERERQRKDVLRLKQEKHRTELLEQISDKQFKRKLLYEEFLKEKIVIDEILAQIEREQIEEMQEKLRKTECLREDIVRLIEEQEEWKNQQKRIEAQENEQIAKYIEAQEKRSELFKEMEYEKRLAMSEQQEKMCAKLDEIEREKLERESLLIELKCKEVHEKQLLRDRKELEERIRQRLKTKLELENQLADMEMRRLQRKQEDEQFRNKQLQLLAEQDRLDMLTKEKQRIKKQEHYQRVREILTARADARQAEVFDLVREQNELMALEKRRQEIFAMERMKILEQHADEIIGYLPQDLLQ